MKVTDEYREGFLKAEATFKYQLVYDPINRIMVPLNPTDGKLFKQSCLCFDEFQMFTLMVLIPGINPEHCSNAGTLLDKKTAFQLALGNLDPFSLKNMDNWDPDNENCKVLL